MSGGSARFIDREDGKDNIRMPYLATSATHFRLYFGFSLDLGSVVLL